MSAALKTGADARAMRETKFPDIFSKKVDMTKVNLPVIKKWVSDEVLRILKTDDDVVTEMIFTILEGSKFPNIKKLQYDVTGFLDRDAAPFSLELWKLCLSAQEDAHGIPKELLQAKKDELLQERIAEEQAREEAAKRQDEDRERERELARIRERERDYRGRGGRGGRGRERSFDRSRSPRRRREFGRGTDSYVPGERRGRNNPPPPPPPPQQRRSSSHGRSPARSRSRSPPRKFRRRNTSSDMSRSPSPPRRRRSPPDNDRGTERGNKHSHFDNRRKLRSPSPRRRRRSPSYSEDERSPPPRRSTPPRRRKRAGSLSSRSRSRSSPPPKRKSQGSEDLISRRTKDRHDAPRLSRESSAANANGGDLSGEEASEDQ